MSGMFTVKLDCPPEDELTLLDAWEAWKIPRRQQREWCTQLYGPQYIEDLGGLLSDEEIAREEAMFDEEVEPNEHHLAMQFG